MLGRATPADVRAYRRFFQAPCRFDSEQIAKHRAPSMVCIITSPYFQINLASVAAMVLLSLSSDRKTRLDKLE
jgi:hypothetical protein